jgi:hypothetical protein
MMGLLDLTFDLSSNSAFSARRTLMMRAYGALGAMAKRTTTLPSLVSTIMRSVSVPRVQVPSAARRQPRPGRVSA